MLLKFSTISNCPASEDEDCGVVLLLINLRNLYVSNSAQSGLIVSFVSPLYLDSGFSVCHLFFENLLATHNRLSVRLFFVILLAKFDFIILPELSILDETLVCRRSDNWSEKLF
ncbi:MAG: hypothetical protein U9Q83_00955 [Bacteroidota bacterium]|nr:hypothetical protein [Bacteroidota bacterium]